MFVKTLHRDNEFNPLMGKRRINVSIRPLLFVRLALRLLYVVLGEAYPLNVLNGKCINCQKLSLGWDEAQSLLYLNSVEYRKTSNLLPVGRKRKHTIASSTSDPFCGGRRMGKENEHIASISASAIAENGKISEETIQQHSVLPLCM